ncbi:MAG: hypothetical protein ACREOF_13585 [Gemmatimonadales bacterium]
MASKKAAARKPGKGAGKPVRPNAGGGKVRAAKAVRPRARVRKNMDMDPVKLAAVKKILGVSTETEAVDRAFDEIIFEHNVSTGLERLASSGGLPDVDPDA